MARSELTIQLEEVLSSYADDVREALVESIKEVADDTVKYLKNTSPKGVRKSKKYANGWKYRDESGRINTKIVVYNTQGQLTHLLEFGHALWFGGRARAFPHIKLAEERAKKMLEDKLIDKLL